jgi:hypothetical protein
VVSVFRSLARSPSTTTVPRSQVNPGPLDVEMLKDFPAHCRHCPALWATKSRASAADAKDAAT